MSIRAIIKITCINCQRITMPDTVSHPTSDSVTYDLPDYCTCGSRSFDLSVDYFTNKYVLESIPTSIKLESDKYKGV